MSANETARRPTIRADERPAGCGIFEYLAKGAAVDDLPGVDSRFRYDAFRALLLISERQD